MRPLPLLCVLLALLVAPFADPARAQDAAGDALGELLSPGESEEADEAAGEGAGSIDTESSPRDDAEIRERLLGIYGALEALDRLEVSVASGVVTLGGTADSAAAGERAVAIAGQVNGVIEVLGEPTLELAEVPAHRWHRWTDSPGEMLGPMPVPGAAAHAGVRAPFAFPDATVLDLVITPTGWRHR